MKFKIGDKVTPKREYTDADGWTNVKMCNSVVGLHIGGVYTVHDTCDNSLAEGGSLFLAEFPDHFFTPERFELSKPSVVLEILNDL